MAYDSWARLLGFVPEQRSNEKAKRHSKAYQEGVEDGQRLFQVLVPLAVSNPEEADRFSRELRIAFNNWKGNGSQTFSTPETPKDWGNFFRRQMQTIRANNTRIIEPVMYARGVGDKLRGVAVQTAQSRIGPSIKPSSSSVVTLESDSDLEPDYVASSSSESDSEASDDSDSDTSNEKPTRKPAPPLPPPETQSEVLEKFYANFTKAEEYLRVKAGSTKEDFIEGKEETFNRVSALSTRFLRATQITEDTVEDFQNFVLLVRQDGIDGVLANLDPRFSSSTWAALRQLMSRCFNERDPGEVHLAFQPGIKNIKDVIIAFASCFADATVLVVHVNYVIPELQEYFKQFINAVVIVSMGLPQLKKITVHFHPRSSLAHLARLVEGVTFVPGIRNFEVVIHEQVTFNAGDFDAFFKQATYKRSNPPLTEEGMLLAEYPIQNLSLSLIFLTSDVTTELLETLATPTEDTFALGEFQHYLNVETSMRKSQGTLTPQWLIILLRCGYPLKNLRFNLHHATRMQLMFLAMLLGERHKHPQRQSSSSSSSHPQIDKVPLNLRTLTIIDYENLIRTQPNTMDASDDHREFRSIFERFASALSPTTIPTREGSIAIEDIDEYEDDNESESDTELEDFNDISYTPKSNNPSELDCKSYFNLILSQLDPFTIRAFYVEGFRVPHFADKNLLRDEAVNMETRHNEELAEARVILEKKPLLCIVNYRDIATGRQPFNDLQIFATQREIELQNTILDDAAAIVDSGEVTAESSLSKKVQEQIIAELQDPNLGKGPKTKRQRT